MAEIMLKIVGTQERDGEKDTIEFMTEGKYYVKNDAVFLVYKESELSGMEGSTTTLKVSEKQVVMKRFGETETELVFERGETHLTLYKTPFGNMDMEVSTTDVRLTMSGETLEEIHLVYDININNISETRNKLSIVIKT